MVQEMIHIDKDLETKGIALFVQTATKYSSSIKVQYDNKIANAKSIMSMISLGITDGKIINLVADGEDADKAIEDLTKFLKTEN